MTYSSPYRWGPGLTPKAIQTLIIVTCCINVISALTDGIFTEFLGISGPQDWLSLSWWGMSRYFFWQPISYLFVQYSGYQGINFFYLLSLFFNMYIIWILSSIVIERVGTAPFMRLYFVSGIFAGLVGLFSMPLFGYTALAGPTPSMLALLVVWTMLHPEAELLLFFLIPAKVKWLTTGVIAAIFLITLSQLDIVHLFFYLSGALTGYCYALIAWNLEGPFSFTHPFDHALAKVGIWGRFKMNRFKKAGKGDKNKVIRFPSNESLKDDDKFVDAMLTKISRRGENALSWSEKRRMDEISKKRAQKP